MAEKSTLQFLGYKIQKSLIEFKGEQSNGFQIGINPYGKIDNSKNIFELRLDVIIDNTQNSFKAEVSIIGTFKFTDKEDKKMESFLYLNAPAILFPYVRAYINTLTALSGNKAIVLPTLNLARLKKNLKKNTTEIE